MPAAPPPGFHHAHVRFREADWHELRAFAERARLPMALALRMLCGLLKADGGEGSCLGFDFRTQSAEIKKHVGYMTQRFSFYEDLSIEENLDFIARLYEIPERKAAVEKSLERLGMVERRKQLAGTLSGGWKQRLALSACLIHERHVMPFGPRQPRLKPWKESAADDCCAMTAGGFATVLPSALSVGLLPAAWKVL